MTSPGPTYTYHSSHYIGPGMCKVDDSLWSIRNKFQVDDLPFGLDLTVVGTTESLTITSEGRTIVDVILQDDVGGCFHACSVVPFDDQALSHAERKREFGYGCLPVERNDIQPHLDFVAQRVLPQLAHLASSSGSTVFDHLAQSQEFQRDLAALFDDHVIVPGTASHPSTSSGVALMAMSNVERNTARYFARDPQSSDWQETAETQDDFPTDMFCLLKDTSGFVQTYRREA